MKVRYSPDFYRLYKRAKVIIRKSVDEKIEMFLKDSNDLELNNHPLEREWEGYQSIDITIDYRAIYKEVAIGDEIVAYFVALGTHEQLYRDRESTN